MIVEEDMIGSCLPHVKINAFHQSLTNGAFKKKAWQKLENNIGAYRSLGLRCRPYSAG